MFGSYMWTLITMGSALFQSFARNTSCHGIKHIVQSDNIFRRLMWLLFVLACLVAVILQIIDRVQYFYSLPLNVNVEINYNQTLDFPAVTICNQNAFRASEAARLGRYRLIEDMFAQSANITKQDLELHNATNLSLEELYTTLAHKKEDFIAKCLWKNAECSAEDFQMMVTDHGVCFSFVRQPKEMIVSSSGVNSGLRLTLNVEQYEYMTGPHDSAGVKILLHDYREMPFVYALGQAVPTGSHAFIGVKFMTIDNQPKPYGECDSKELSHTTYYTTEECYSDCIVKLATSRCHCRDTYMPHYNGSPPVCTLEEYYSCLKPLEDEFESVYREQCGCPVPCHFAIYDPSISYASVSNHLVKKLLTSTDANNLKQRLEVASEVTARMDKDTFSKFQVLVKHLFSRYEVVKHIVTDILSCLCDQKNNTRLVAEEMKQSYLTKERIYRYQQYAIEKNFLRGREAMEERTLTNVANAYGEFALLNYRRIRRLALDNDTGEEAREELYKLTIDVLKTRQDICEKGRANVSLLIESFINGTPIFNYKFEDLPRAHNPYIVPKYLMNYSMHYNHYMLKYVPKLKTNDFDILNDTLQWFQDEATKAYENRTVNETRLNYVYERFQFACRTFMYSKSVVYSLGIDMPLKVITERLADFDKQWSDFDSEVHEINQNLNSMEELIQTINSESFPVIDSAIARLENYTKEGTGSLMEIAEFLFSNETQFVISKVKNFFREIRTRGQAIDDLANLLQKPIFVMWKMIIDDEDSFDYYNYTNNELFMRNLSDVENEWASKMDEIRAGDLRKFLLNNDEDFVSAFNEISTYLEEFRDSLVVDRNFLRQNFLQLDIFYRQLSYEYISQQKAYDFFALISDIGGAMGLFIGASMLTILEIIDLFLIQLPIFKHKNEIKRSPSHQ